MMDTNCIHHFLYDLNGVFTAGLQAKTKDAIHSFRVTIITYIVTLHTPCLTMFLFMTDDTFHQHIFFQIFQWRITNQTFLFQSRESPMLTWQHFCCLPSKKFFKFFGSTYFLICKDGSCGWNAIFRILWASISFGGTSYFFPL